MPSEPWTIQRSKRKQPISEPSARKRVRISDDVNRDTPTTSRRINQKTLTQIDFVQSPYQSTDGLGKDEDLQEIPPVGSNSGNPQNVRRKLRKQSSTLTQMSWLQDTATPSEQIENDLLIEVGLQSSRARVIQLDGRLSDGGSVQPKVSPRKERSAGLDGTVSISGKRSSRGSRANSEFVEDDASSRRRRSGRIASKPAIVSEVAVLRPDPQMGDLPVAEDVRQTVFHHPAPLLEIRDSTEMTSLRSSSGMEEVARTVRHSTPPRQYIASSQTPETRQQSSIRRLPLADESPTKAVRTPLAEKSTNIPAKRGTKRKTPHKLNHPERRSPPQKIYILKVPPRTLLRRGSRVEDSQHDVFSLKGTSSPMSQDHTNHEVSSPTDGQIVRPDSPKIVTPKSPEAISQGPSQFESQASLPQLSDLIPSRRQVRPAKSSSPKNGGEFSQAAACDAVHVRDFGDDQSHKSQRKTAVRFDLDEMLLEGDPVTLNLSDPLNENEEDVEQCSPIQNDTQFNAELEQRASSPILKHGQSEAEDNHEIDHKFATPKQNPSAGANRAKFSANSSTPTLSGDETPMPIPRLVSRATPSAGLSSLRHGDKSMRDAMLPPVISYSSTTLAVSKVPLNDLSTTSPLPTSTQPLPSQKAVQPASMCHPSQISTQDPTQHYLPSSIAHSIAVTQPPERITIKDSSSEDDHFTQIQTYDRAVRAPQPDSRVIGDSEDELDDLDLDLASKPQYSARKPVGRQITKTESSLKSIHVSGISSSSSNQARSSSPVLPAQEHNVVSAPVRSSANNVTHEILDLLADIPTSSSSPVRMSRARSPIAGFDNDTQSDFTQNGHVTAAYIHKQRDLGRYPKWFVPKPTVVTGSVRKSNSRKGR